MADRLPRSSSMDSINAHVEPQSQMGLKHDPPKAASIKKQECSNDDDDEHDEDDNDDDISSGGAESIVGVSIGREQSRLNSPSTPAAERSAAFDHRNEWGFFSGDDEEAQQEVLLNTLKNTRHSQDGQTLAPVKDWSLGGNEDQIAKATSVRDRSQSDVQRGISDWTSPRSRNSVINLLGDTSLRRFIANLNLNPLSESSTSKHRASSSVQDPKVGASAHPNRGRSNSVFLSRFPWTSISPRLDTDESGSFAKSGASAQESPELSPSVATRRSQMSDQVANTTLLRRTSSDDCFIRPVISRQSTLASVLGDDTEWEQIKQQVNSRRKAIKDSLQDSLPQLPNIDLSTLWPNVALKLLKDIEKSTPRFGNTSKLSEMRPIDTSSIGEKDLRSISPPRLLKSRTPSLDAALEQLTGDIVVMGGYRGSVLRSAEAPYRQLWVPVKVGLGVRKVNLEVGLNSEDEEEMHRSIVPSGMLTHIGPVDMSRRLLKRLRGCTNAKNGTLRVWDYGYDWRLSPALLSRRLVQFLEGLPCNTNGRRGAVVIAHSLGGLITRHAVNQRPELFAGIVYAGTPQHCVNILGPLRNGDDVLLSSKVLTAQVNFSFRTSFLLLPENGYCFLDKETKEAHHVDFFDAENWQRYALSPCVAAVHPPWNIVERKSIFSALSSSLPSIISASEVMSTDKRLGPLPSRGSPTEELTASEAENTIGLGNNTDGMDMSTQSLQPLTGCTISPSDAMDYLRRVLAEISRFKKELNHKSDLEAHNRYPPHALIFGTSVPTVYGARVAGREAIKHSDAYDDLVFAAGDGVVLARAAMLPRGYKVVEGARVRTERGHVALLGDLEAVGKCLIGISRGRAQGMGSGKLAHKDSKAH